MAGTVIDTYFNFELIDPCNPAEEIVITNISPPTYVLSDLKQTIDYPVYTVSPSYCAKTEVLTVAEEDKVV